MKLNLYKSCILIGGLFVMTLTSCGAECKTCTANGNASIMDEGLVCPEDFTSAEAFDTFIKQYEVLGGVCD